MYIKQIIIQGFKSYKDQTEVEPFSPKTNVVVGRNGSGKSNFFAAIRFVLGDAYSQMGREERQGLLHEGSGSAVMSAYVEIIFDNSDDRFPTGNKELILRRTINLKKDDYSLDRKNATRTDVMNLLESAGFSRSNSYYIVPQGKVTGLTNMKDAARLQVLKDVAGTQVYEARRAESIKIMNDTDNKRSKIDELLKYINERLGELEEEKDELRSYQEKDKDRRCLEYAFYHREQTAIATALDRIEDLRADGIDDTDKNREDFLEGEKAITELETEIKHLNRQVDLLKLERRQLDDDRKEAAKSQAKLELEVKALRDGLSTTEKARSKHQQDLKSVKQDIAKKEAELTRLGPDYEKRKANEASVKEALDASEAARTRLYTKQGRSSQFKSKAERDAWLKKEIENLQLAVGNQKAIRMDAEEEVNSVKSGIGALEKDIEGLRERLEGWTGTRQALFDEVTQAKDSLEKLNDEKKLLQREEDKLESNIEEARQERDRAEKDLSHTMDGATSRGLATIRRLKRERNIPGAYGTLAELIEVPDNYRIAAEQTAGQSLFHYVVDNADTATHLADALYKQKGGRLTFMPLSELHPGASKLPNASDAVPLMNKIKFEAKYEKAVKQVFGKTVVCPSIAVAQQYARSHRCNAITPDGDITNERGATTGGWIDQRKSRLRAVQAVNVLRDEYDKLKNKADEVRREMEKKEEAKTNALGGRRKLEQKLNHLDDSFDPMRTELRAKNSYLEKQREQLEANLRQRDNVDYLIKNHNDSISNHELELKSDFKKSLSADEERQLEQLNSDVQELQKQWNELSKSRRELERRKQLLEVELRESKLKLDQLNSQEIDATVSSGSGNLKESERALKSVQKASANIEGRLEENESQAEELRAKIFGLEKEKVQRVEKQQATARSIERHQKDMEKSVAKKALLTQSAAECSKNIRDLGVLPDEAFEKYSNIDSKTIQSRLKKVNEALKKYKHVNKKAFEQYNNFTTQRDSLTKRRKELDDSQASISELVQTLDQHKDEAIERTFKQVSKEFAQIFERLVPAGRGRLIIQRKTDQRARDDDESDDEQRENVENYTGVGISVSFNSKHDEQQRIQQLSGGQKSLCALALVFAIQQCDPAPFYLFDEIDANLDAQYRTAVAQMLEDISTQQSTQNGDNGAGGMSGQFICTTFRPEMLLVADKCYGVTFHNKTSGIDVVTREEALAFVEGEAPR